jgi:hypothetical protein
VALAIAAPVESVTVPAMLPEVLWAKAAPAAKAISRPNTNVMANIRGKGDLCMKTKLLSVETQTFGRREMRSVIFRRAGWRGRKASK